MLFVRSRALVFVVLLALAGCGARGCGSPPPSPAGPSVTVAGTALGAVRRVRLVDVEQDLIVTATPAANGSFSLTLPPGTSRGPRLMLEGDGGALVVSGVLGIETGNVSLAPLDLWRAPIDVGRDGPKVRFSWPRCEPGPGRPRVVRYSLLFTFGTRPGHEAERAEASLVTKENEAVQTVDEMSALLRDRDPAATKIQMAVRAFDPTDAPGPTWSGGPAEWELPKDLPAPPR